MVENIACFYDIKFEFGFYVNFLIDIQVISQPVESLPANSYFTSLAALESDNEVKRMIYYVITK